jgi:hydroxymethylglutaryl-CoA lyase
LEFDADLIVERKVIIEIKSVEAIALVHGKQLMDRVKIIECPRDAWQGLTKIIPTDAKVTYLLKLIEYGFRHLDAVSFVAPKYVPQMADSEAVMRHLVRGDLTPIETGNLKIETGADPSFRFPISSFPVEIIGIVVNDQGLKRALATVGVTTLGYPYSVSANFRRANANMSLGESRNLVQDLQRATKAAGRNLVVYVSMAFGNHYGEPWSPQVTADAVSWLQGIGIRTISLADTAGTAQPEDVTEVLRHVQTAAPGIELGVHLHSRMEGATEKVLAAYEAGCRRFESALTGLGGCPFAGDDLVGNIPTETVVSTLAKQGVDTGMEPWAVLSAVEATRRIRQKYAQDIAPT